MEKHFQKSKYPYTYGVQKYLRVYTNINLLVLYE